MAEYIEREALLDEIHDLIIDDDPTIPEKLYNNGIRRIERLINRTNAADVVEVVRCKDCAYSNEDGTRCHYGVGRDTEPMGYCHKGAKMDGKGEGEC